MPLALGALVMVVMYTWRRGSRLLFEKTRKQRNAARRAGRDAGEEAAAARARHGGVSHQRSDQRADRADAQPQALQGAAREERHPHHRDRATRRASTRTSACRSSRSARPSRGSRCASASWKRRTCRRRWRSRASSAGSSTSCRRRSSCRGARSSRPRIPACRAGRTGCSSALARSRQRRHRLFPDPDRAGGGGRNPGHDLVTVIAADAALARIPAINRAASGNGSCVMADEMPRADEVARSHAGGRRRGPRRGPMLLVDVREPNETAVERYPDAVMVPLSSFDPAQFPIRRASRWCLPAAPAGAR